MMMLPEKECEICGVIFQPNRANQKYCPECQKHPERKKREYSRALARSIREYGTGYEEPVFFETKCKYCGKNFRNNKFQKLEFCSDECEHKWILEHIRCANCGRHATETDQLPKHYTYHWFCSEKCKHEAWMKSLREQGKTHLCPVCGKEIPDTKTYCSQECYEKGRPKAKIYSYTCLYCGKQGMSNTPKKFCSQECYKAAVKSGWKASQATKKQNKPEKQKESRRELAAKAKEVKQKKYIQENGLCGICKTPYADCIRMTSNFRYLPEGAKSPDGKKVLSCPQYTK